MTLDVKEIPNCPECGSDNVVPIIYGYPGPKLWEDYQAGIVDLGGCCITRNDPRWRCKACRNAWPHTDPGGPASAHLIKPHISRKFRPASPLDNLRAGR